MPVEKSAGAIIFRQEPSFAKATDGKEGKIYYLLLHYPSSVTRAAAKGKEEGLPSSPKAAKEYWDLPKGHIEKGEKIEDTAKREVEEETGLKDIELVEGFKETVKYFFRAEGKNILKFVTFFLAETKTPHQNKFGTGQAPEVKISEEHIGYEWLPYEGALKKITFKNAKDILKKANDFIIEHKT